MKGTVHGSEADNTPTIAATVCTIVVVALGIWAFCAAIDAEAKAVRNLPCTPQEYDTIQCMCEEEPALAAQVKQLLDKKDVLVFDDYCNIKDAYNVLRQVKGQRKLKQSVQKQSAEKE
jgi:hypothetical protein